MNDILEWLQRIPIVCLIGLLYFIAFLLLPICQLLRFKYWVKKYGKEEATEIARRY